MLTLVTLGRLSLTAAGLPLLAGRRKLLVVLAYLARLRGRPVTRAHLASLFWPVEDEARARRSVRQTMTELRRAAGGALLEREEGVSLVEGLVEFDASNLETAVAAGDYQRAVDLWGGEFLHDAEDVGSPALQTWLEAERQKPRSQFARAAEALAEQAERRGDWAAGLAVTGRWSQTLPYDERASMRHTRLLSLAGKRSEAKDFHAAFVVRLRDELGEEPSADFLRFAEAHSAPPSSDDPPARPGGRALMSPDLIARESEFAALTALWENVRAGEPGLVLIEGEEGSGKTRLAEEFVRWATHRYPGAVLLRARAFQAEAGRPWVLLRHLLAGLGSAPGLGAAPSATLKALTEFVPEIAERFRALPAGATDVRHADTVARALREVAVEAPVVVLVDDAHYMDPESRELVETIYRHPIDGVLMALTSLPDQFPGLTSLDRGRATPGLSRLRLNALSQGDIERVLASMADFVPADRHALAGRLCTESGGNPLVVTELMMTLADRGVVAPGPNGLWALQRRLDDVPLPVPASLRDAASARVRQLPADTIRVLEAAAVLGRESEFRVLREVTGLDGAPLDDAVDQLVGRRFLRIAEDGSSRLEFSHETVRQVVYQDMSPARRAAHHHRAWRVLRRTGAQDSAQRAAVEHHRARMVSGGRRKRVWVAAAATLLVLATGVTALFAYRSSGATPSPTRIAVLPFTVRGSAPYGYLGEGMVSLLSANLDGLGGLRTADPRGLLAFVSREPDDPERGEAAARHFGAGLFVQGDIIETNGRLDLTASLYDAEGDLQTVARATAATEAGILDAVDDLARQLLVSRRPGPADEMTRLAAATSSSLPALKAYLEGERQLREGHFGAAVEAFQTATRIDTAFALAYYRLAIAAEWDQEITLPERAAEQAVRYGSRLSERPRAMVEALLAWRRGDAAAARDRYAAILYRHPDDLEAWFQLGEVLFHSNPVYGRSIAEATEAWERVLLLEPDNRFALLHLARIAAAENDTAVFRPHVQAAMDARDGNDRRLLEVAALHAILVGDRREEERSMAELQQLPTLASVVGQMIIYSRDLAATERLTRLLMEQKPLQGLGNLWLGQVELARGRWRAAEEKLAGISEFDPGEPSARAFIASLPFVPMSTEQLLRIRNEYDSWTGPIDSGSVTLHRVIKGYLLGAISARAGDHAAALQYASALDGIGSPPRAAALSRNLALGLRARVARHQGQPEAALRLLEQIRPTARREEVSQSPFAALALERYLRAELLRETGRGEEALAWYASMGQLSTSELVFLAPSHLHRAAIYETLGRRTDAAAHYTRAIELWKDADPESQSLVAEARSGLERVRQ